MLLGEMSVVKSLKLVLSLVQIDDHLKFTSGRDPTRTACVIVLEQLCGELVVTVNFTFQILGVVNKWLGFWVLSVAVPSPKSHDQLTMLGAGAGLAPGGIGKVEASVKLMADETQ